MKTYTLYIKNWMIFESHHHNPHQLLFAGEQEALFTDTVADGLGNESNTMNETKLHSQVLWSAHVHTNTQKEMKTHSNCDLWNSAYVNQTAQANQDLELEKYFQVTVALGMLIIN